MTVDAQSTDRYKAVMTDKVRSWPFMMIYLLPAAVFLGAYWGGINTLTALIWAFVWIPIMDFLFGLDTKNPEREIEKDLTDSLSFRMVTWGCVPALYATLIFGAWMVTNGTMSVWESIGLTISVGITGGVMGINVAHELIHRDVKAERLLGRMMLWTVNYTHWAIEHVYGHHAQVATPNDPATAKRGETFYAFWPRTVKGTWLSAWHLEKRRLGRMKKPVWSHHNQILRGVGMQILVAAGLTAAFGPWALAFFIGQSIVAFSLLEVVNYLEHYGLERRQLDNGKYEQVTPIHSWNAANRITNLFLFHLQRHSDHHANAGRRYQVLRHFEHSPQLPTGYAGMVLLALVPPLWFKVMNPKVDHYRNLVESGEVQRIAEQETAA
ncbi:MAG: alkane 1-monooxygenase [Deltaproteobacteria bacterium]|nr:alkane 1-monooxygenase [bacterium]MCB9479889.1 alkane 1-monooxygenase [Deltaproteobacteria bacterium]MCB9489712.1 alkane 1-monooxygenase [Deltaproteobacteria bacterium]